MSSQTIIETTLRASVFCVLIGAMLASTGCSTLPLAQSQALPTAATAATESQGVYEVQMQGAFAKTSVSRGVIDGPITVQTVLQRSGALKKFRNMDITLLRIVKENGQPLKLPVDFIPAKKTIRPEQDYAIHPNDRILIVSRSNNTIDKIVDTVTNNR